MTDAPKHAGDYPDRAIDCEMAIEPHLLRIVDDLAAVGMSRHGAAQRVADTIERPEHDDLVAEEIASIVTWAVSAGWGASEISAALCSLGPNVARAAIDGVPD